MREDQLFSGNRLKADDLIKNGQPISPVVTIEKVYSDDFGKGDTKRVAKLRGTDKELVLNKTNWKAVAKISGQADDDYWSGVQVQLVRKYVEYQGENVPAIRVQPPGGWERWEREAQARQIQPLAGPAPAPTQGFPDPGNLPPQVATGTGPLASDVRQAMSGVSPHPSGELGADDLPF